MKKGLISCYSDNAAVFEGFGVSSFRPTPLLQSSVFRASSFPPSRFRYTSPFLPPEESEHGMGGIWEIPSQPRRLHLVAKAETHNHPTGISPWPGAATGVGGEIRDETAVGRGGMSKAGVSAYMVSGLGMLAGKPQDMGSLSPEEALFAGPRKIMCDGPLGAARYGNEFGRPQLVGSFRTLELRRKGKLYGYDKPLMLAGGLGNVEEGAALKAPRAKKRRDGQVKPGDLVVVLGGRAMRIGLGGGAASSKTGDGEDAFASVQRANPEIQRRCQQVVDFCRHMDDNPILLIHDVGAGGLSNAIPELLHDAGMGMGKLIFSRIPTAQKMSPLETWCNESQERFVLVIKKELQSDFSGICMREGCHYATLGALESEESPRLRSVHSDEGNEEAHEQEEAALDVPLEFLFGAPAPGARILPDSLPAEKHGSAREVQNDLLRMAAPNCNGREALTEVALQVLGHPAVASKAFLIHIADRNVGGLTGRDQLVGPFQIPVADCATTLADPFSKDGEALAMGERPALALYNPAASARMALGEAVTNIAAAPLKEVSDIRLSANWMASCRSSNEEDADPWGGDRALYDGVDALSEACCDLGIAIPVGKDSLFMASDAWKKHGSWVPAREGTPERVRSPMSVVLTAFAAVRDVAKTATPLLRAGQGSHLVRIGLSKEIRLGGSIWEQIARAAAPEAVDELSPAVPDLDEPGALKGLIEVLYWLRTHEAGDSLWAYHDISDGGLLACLVEMAFSSGCGLKVKSGEESVEALASWLLNEELGAVAQVPEGVLEGLQREAESRGLAFEDLGSCAPVKPTQDAFSHGFSLQVDADSHSWELPLWPVGTEEGEGSALRAWTHASDCIRLSRGDAEESVEKEYASLCEGSALLTPKLPLEWQQPKPKEKQRALFADRPKIAVLRTSGSNGQAEMAAAFYRAGFEPVDVHMSDFAESTEALMEFDAIAFVGGFSDGDVLGAGRGWAADISRSYYVKEGQVQPRGAEEHLGTSFRYFFESERTLVLGICNGCQLLSHLRDLIPGAEHWPEFARNTSRQHEARLVQTLIDPKLAESSPWLKGMGGAVLPVAVSHGEGRAKFADGNLDQCQVPMRYCAADHSTKDVPYPANPNGSEGAVAAVSAANGRVLAMMPHPERSLRNLQFSWCPEDWDPLAPSPWQQMFNNAADWLKDRK